MPHSEGGALLTLQITAYQDVKNKFLKGAYPGTGFGTISPKTCNQVFKTSKHGNR